MKSVEPNNYPLQDRAMFALRDDVLRLLESRGAERRDYWSIGLELLEESLRQNEPSERHRICERLCNILPKFCEHLDKKNNEVPA